MKPFAEVSRLLHSRFEGILNSERAQFTLTVGAVFLLIIIKGSQPNIVSSVVRHYVEETSASVIPTESPTLASDINALMGSGVMVNSQTSGQGGTGHDAN